MIVIHTNGTYIPRIGRYVMTYEEVSDGLYRAMLAGRSREYPASSDGFPIPILLDGYRAYGSMAVATMDSVLLDASQVFASCDTVEEALAIHGHEFVLNPSLS